MDIRSSMDGLRSLLGVNAAAPPTAQAKNPVAANAESGLSSDLATLSSAASEISQAALGEGIRTGKVAAVQAALAAGTYNVPASAVASKLVDAMLSGGQ
jgi:negative regulator of flagellin synthesis FlgM